MRGTGSGEWFFKEHELGGGRAHLRELWSLRLVHADALFLSATRSILKT